MNRTSGYAAARRWVWGLAVALSMVLLGVSVNNVREAGRLQDTVLRGQAAMLMEAARWATRPGHVGPKGRNDRVDHDDQEERVGAIVDLVRGGSLGLRYLGLVSRQGDIEAFGESTSSLGPREVDALRLMEPVRYGDRVRVLGRGSPPPRPQKGEFGELKGPPPGPPRAPRILLEFEPQLADAMVERAERDAIVGMVSTLLLLAGAWLFRGLTLRVEKRERSMAHRRHLAGLGEMSAVLAHEIRNPLASLKGHAQLLAEFAQGAVETKAQTIVAEATRLEALTHDLLDFARTGEVVRSPTDPVVLVTQAASSLDEERFDIDTTDAPTSWPLDATRTTQVCTNLFENALQASGEQGRVHVRVAVESDVLILEVRDEGSGLLADPQRIFEPFVTTRTRGTGLGLAVVRRVVQLHGGDVEASDHPDGGALFRVSIGR